MIVRDSFRWLVVLAAVLAVLALIAFARGDKHHHGDEVGALGPAVVAIT